MNNALAQATRKMATIPEWLSFNRGLEVYIERDHAAVKYVLSQVYHRYVFKPKDLKTKTNKKLRMYWSHICS